MFGGYLIAGALLIGVVSGYAVRDWQCDAAYSKALEKAAKERQVMQDELNSVSASYEAIREESNGQREVRTNTIREIYKRIPAPSADCAADTGIVGLLESGVNSANAAATGKSGD